MSKILVIASSAAWRGRVTQEFPDDARNTVAKDILEKLAAHTVPDGIIARLNQYSDSEIAREATTVAKWIGFRYFPNTLSSFANEVIDRIEIPRGEWAKTFRREGV